MPGTIPEKSQTGGLRTNFFEKSPGIFRILTLHLQIPDKTKLQPWKLSKIVTPLGNSKA